MNTRTKKLVMAALLAALRPVIRRFIKPKVMATNVDALVGSRGYVTEDINNVASTGQVKLGAMPWTARSDDGLPIAAGTLVQVRRVEGVKAIVSPVKEDVKV